MRQVGVLAGPGIVALNEMIPELKIDNQMASNLSNKLSQIQHLIIKPYTSLSSNMVFFKFDKDEFNIEKSQEFVDYMLT